MLALSSPSQATAAERLSDTLTFIFSVRPTPQASPHVDINNINIDTYIPHQLLQDDVLQSGQQHKSLQKLVSRIRRDFVAPHIASYGSRVCAAGYPFEGPKQVTFIDNSAPHHHDQARAHTTPCAVRDPSCTRPGSPRTIAQDPGAREPRTPRVMASLGDEDAFMPTLANSLVYSRGPWQPTAGSNACPKCSRNAILRQEFFERALNAIEMQAALQQSTRPPPEFITTVARHAVSDEVGEMIRNVFKTVDAADALAFLVAAGLDLEAAADLVRSAAHDIKHGYSLMSM